MKHISGSISLTDRILIFQHFLQQTTHRKKCENGFFYTGFSCSWFWKSPNLQNHKHRCRWPMSLLQNQKHSIWTEKKLGLWMSFGFFWISLGLLDGHSKYQELGFPTDCGEKLWREIYLFLLKHISGSISPTDRNLFFQHFFATKNS